MCNHEEQKTIWPKYFTQYDSFTAFILYFWYKHKFNKDSWPQNQNIYSNIKITWGILWPPLDLYISSWPYFVWLKSIYQYLIPGYINFLVSVEASSSPYVAVILLPITMKSLGTLLPGGSLQTPVKTNKTYYSNITLYSIMGNAFLASLII